MRKENIQFINGVERVLKNRNILYIEVGTPVTDGEDTLDKSNLGLSNLNAGSVAIIKKGEIYTSLNPDEDAIKNDEETENWLSKYIDIK